MPLCGTTLASPVVSMPVSFMTMVVNVPVVVSMPVSFMTMIVTAIAMLSVPVTIYLAQMCAFIAFFVPVFIMTVFAMPVSVAAATVVIVTFGFSVPAIGLYAIVLDGYFFILFHIRTPYLDLMYLPTVFIRFSTVSS